MQLAFGVRGGLPAMAAAILACLLGACGGPGTTGPLYTIGGSVAGLSGSGLVLQLNSADDLAVPVDGSFTFSTALAPGTRYTVSVKVQPGSPQQVCLASPNSGVAGTVNVTDIAISCTLTSCPPDPPGSATPGATLYILDEGPPQDDGMSNAQVLEYPANKCGSENPTTSLTLPSSVSSYRSVTVDSSEYLYVGAYLGSAAGQSEVLVFAPGAAGTAMPLRTLVFPGFINGAVTDSGGNLYVATSATNIGATNNILVFAPGADGNAIPTRTIVVSTGEQAFGCSQLAVDPGGNIVCSFNELGMLQIYANDASGSATPARTIYTDSEIAAFGLDPAGNIYVAVAVELHFGLPVGILAFTGGTGSSDTPTKTLLKGAFPNSGDTNSLGFDAVGNFYIYESSETKSSVLTFAPDANGFASPITENLAGESIFPNGTPNVFAVH